MVRLPDAEFEVMQAVWACGGISVPTLVLSEKLSRGWKAQTILTLLSRLESKGVVKSEKVGKERIWTAQITEDEYLSFEAKNIVERMYHGSFSGLVNAFYEGETLSEEDASALLKWIDQKTSKEGKK
ncbi:MAG: BlaI/MecI/CopY family transcriptional regulator [Clostridia bacterium]|nr:BlaI/MecI/CopY family transcriptional regulator [Clostridia bacterium]MBP3554459.1 BlaI/MecI/CopY family transcriptional regulator [Clostridia bacterium]MBQ8419854.1 BlaI/MecI/CopY family transcriptional regulator [Clostridia bacterium]